MGILAQRPKKYILKIIRNHFEVSPEVAVIKSPILRSYRV